MNSPTLLKGIIHGRIIELEKEPGLQDGQEVTILLRPGLSSGEGIQQSAGGWAGADDELDAWLDEMQRSRQQGRPELD